MDNRSAKRIVMIAFAVLLVFCLIGCGSAESNPLPEEAETEISDEMFTEEVDDATLYVFQLDGRVYTADDYVYEIDAYIDDSLEDGGFYKLTADVEFLNGGVAGYVDYPQILEVKDFEEVSPFDIDLPYITDGIYGVRLIGDYADGDVLVNEYDIIAVLKEGDWIYRYDDILELDDGTCVCCMDGVSEDSITMGINEGILLCEEYFALPKEQL